MTRGDERAVAPRRSPSPDAPRGRVELLGVWKSYLEGGRRRTVLRGVDAEFEPGEFVAVLGRSGSGKSTLLNLIAGIDMVDDGDVVIGGTTLSALGESARTRLRRRHLGFVFQFFQLIPTLTVGENIGLPLELVGLARDDAERRIEAMLERVGLADRRGSFPDVLSGGEQQRVAVARAIVHRPAVILADEPTGNLDSRAGASVLSLLRELTLEVGSTVVMATHSRAAARQADRVALIEDGQLRVTDARALPAL